jgi:hypothetical protein
MPLEAPVTRATIPDFDDVLSGIFRLLEVARCEVYRQKLQMPEPLRENQPGAVVSTPFPA